MVTPMDTSLFVPVD